MHRSGPRKGKKTKKNFFNYKKRHPFLKSRTQNLGVSVVAQWLANPTRNHEVMSSIPGLAQWVKDLALPGAVV